MANKKKNRNYKICFVGIVKYTLISAAILLGNGLLINKKIEINNSILITIIAISILTPIINWFMIESRYKKYIG
jgi:hypothetical protein